MNEEKDREIRRIKDEWKKENDLLEPINLSPNTFNNSVNFKRNEVAQKYIKQIREVERKYSKHPT